MCESERRGFEWNRNLKEIEDPAQKSTKYSTTEPAGYPSSLVERCRRRRRGLLEYEDAHRWVARPEAFVERHELGGHGLGKRRQVVVGPEQMARVIAL